MRENEEMELKPSTIHSYVRGIQLSFSVHWGYGVQFLSDPVFNDPNTGLKTVLDKKCRQLQVKGLIAQGYNVLSDNDVLKLYNSKHLRSGHLHGLILRVILIISLATTWRPVMLTKLKCIK